MWMLGVDVELIPQCIGSVPLKDRREHNWTAGAAPRAPCGLLLASALLAALVALWMR